MGYSVQWQSRDSLSLSTCGTLSSSSSPPSIRPIPEGANSSSGSEFDCRDLGVTYASDSRNLVNYELGTRYGSYYNGTRWNVNGKLYWRVQPFSNLAMAGSYDKIELPGPYNSANLFLIGPRLDLTFTDKLFLTTYVQYNNQIDNLNLNIRLPVAFRARIRPVYRLQRQLLPGGFSEQK